MVGRRRTARPLPRPRNQGAGGARAQPYRHARHGRDHPGAGGDGSGAPVARSAQRGALRRDGARRRRAPDRLLCHRARRRAAVCRQSRQSVVAAAPGKPAHPVHLAGDCRRVPRLARSDHRRARQHRHRCGQEPRHGVVGIEAAVHADAVRIGGGVDQPLDRSPPAEAQQPRAVDANRPREVRERFLDRPQHAHGLECCRRRSHRLDRTDRRHRLGIWASACSRSPPIS